MFKKFLTSILCILLFLIVFPTKQFNADTFTVSFDANGGLFNEEEVVEVLVDTEKKTIDLENWPNDPVRKGYNFDGFTIEDNKIDKEHIFEENCIVKASWVAKTTNITLNIIDGKDGETLCVATYDTEMPDVVIPNKEGYNFVGYFDNEDVQYYDAFGKSLKIWDKEESEYTLFAKYEEISEELQEEPQQTPELTGLLGDPQMYTATINLDGGTLIGDVPDGWTKQSSNYVKQYVKDTDLDDIMLEWKDAVYKEGYIVNDSFWGWNREPWTYYLDEDVTITIGYLEACTISSSIEEHGSFGVKVEKIAKSTWIYFEDNCIVYSFDKKLIEVIPESGYAVDYWSINGVKQTDTSYFVEGDISIVPHLVQYYGVKAFGKIVTVDNYTDVLGDGTCSYNPETQALTLSKSNTTPEDETKYYYNGIISDHDLTINCLCNAHIYSTSIIPFNDTIGSFGVFCSGDLTINAEKKITFESSYGENAIGIFAENIIINKGNVEAKGNYYGASAVNSFTMNSENSPIFTCSSNNLVGLMTTTLNLNGATVYGAKEGYEESPQNLYQIALSPIIISFNSLATQYNIWIGETRITDDNKDSNPNYKYDPSTKTLTVQGYINGTKGYGVYCLDDLNIMVGNQSGTFASINSNGTSVMGESYGIYCTGDLTIDSDYQDAILAVNSSTCARKSVGVFCDGRLTVKAKLEATPGTVNNNNEGFAISAGVWARQGIDVIGNDINKEYINATAGAVKKNGYANYAILSGDGNPGYDKNATLNVTNARIYAAINDYTFSNASSFAVYSYGAITLNTGDIEASIDSYVEDDSSIIYSGDNMYVINGSNIRCDDIQFFNEHIVVKGLEVNGTLTVDDSEIFVVRTDTDNEYVIENMKLKKYQGIYVKNLIVKGENAVVYSNAHKAVNGDSVAIYITKQLTAENGLIHAYGDDAGGNSYGLYAGRDSFDGKHAVKGGVIVASAKEAGDGESVAIRTKKGQLEFTGGFTAALYAKDYGISASDVITVKKIDYDNYPTIDLMFDAGQTVIKSKEVFVLNDATILGSRNEYDPTSTCEFIQDKEDEPVIISFRSLVTIESEMEFPNNKGYYVSGDDVKCVEVPRVYDVSFDEYLVEGEDFDLSDITYTYYKYNGVDYDLLSNKPVTPGVYKVVITCYNDYYEGQGEVYFNIFENDNVVIKDNIIAHSINKILDSDVIDIWLDGISAEEAKKLFFDGSQMSQRFLEAIDNNETIILTVESSPVADENIFASKNINSSNAILFDLSFSAQLPNGTKQTIYSTGEFSPRISAVVRGQAGEKIVGSNKEYYVYREHDGNIDELNSIMSKNINDFVFTFNTNKFSSYALFSKEKPTSKKTSHRAVPNTRSL